MKTTDLSFEIAEITFRYIYASEIEISDDATIHNFLISKQEKYDVINHVEICKNLVEECIVDEEPAFKAPAWTLYDSFVIFHPNGEVIAKMEFSGEFTNLKTLIKDLSFSKQPLPICITGFLLQRILIKKKRGFIMHGAVIRVNNEAFVLTGNSGVGKSTLSSIISNTIECERISDDRYIIVKKGNKYFAYGNPFDTKAERNLNKGVEIKSIFFLHHSLENGFEKVKEEMIMKKMFTVSMLPYWKKELLYWSISVLKQLTNQLNVVDLYFKPSKEIVYYMIENRLLVV
ncbi:hypothetical protein [Methanobrevibacter ruminantium]|uniref:hypothetical protein n=1 Tax=Methanobrevibacter ruminantium TaxID=83816 RepID=UPI0026EAF2F0|nr:hypothetical protein [Methanobrevibacter ruminantium]